MKTRERKTNKERLIMKSQAGLAFKDLIRFLDESQRIRTELNSIYEFLSTNKSLSAGEAAGIQERVDRLEADVSALTNRQELALAGSGNFILGTMRMTSGNMALCWTRSHPVNAINLRFARPASVNDILECQREG